MTITDEELQPLIGRRERFLWAAAFVVLAVTLAVVLTLHFTAWAPVATNSNDVAACHDAKAIMASGIQLGGNNLAANLSSDGLYAEDPAIRAGALLVAQNYLGGSGTLYFKGLTEVASACQRLGLS